MSTYSSLKIFLLLVSAPALFAVQQEPLPIRLATSYTVFSKEQIDTTAATRVFVTALATDSLVRVLPPILDPSGAVRIQGALYVLTLSVDGTVSRLQLRARAVSVLSGRQVLNGSALIGPADRLDFVLDSVGRRMAKQLTAIASGG